jgi:hypothetical protein
LVKALFSLTDDPVECLPDSSGGISIQFIPEDKRLQVDRQEVLLRLFEGLAWMIAEKARHHFDLPRSQILDFIEEPLTGDPSRFA